MTAANADRCIARTIHKYEGTKLDLDRRDRGNWTSGKIGIGELKGTRYGIAAFIYPNEDIANLTEARAITIYKRDYWPKVCGDLLPVGADLTEWDCCVNSGASRAVKCANKALNASGLSAGNIATALNARSADASSFIKKANAARRSFLLGLNNAVYQNGWLRRVADVEATSLAWYHVAVDGAVVAQKKLEQETASAETAKKKEAASTGGAGAGGGATVGHASQQEGFDWLLMAEWGLALTIIGVTVYFAYRFVVQKQRADAMRAAVAELGSKP